MADLDPDGPRGIALEEVRDCARDGHPADDEPEHGAIGDGAGARACEAEEFACADGPGDVGDAHDGAEDVVEGAVEVVGLFGEEVDGGGEDGGGDAVEDGDAEDGHEGGEAGGSWGWDVHGGCGEGVGREWAGMVDRGR